MTLAISITKTFESGIKANSYARIDSLSGSKTSIRFTLNYYLSQEAFKDMYTYLQQETHTFTPSVAKGSENFIKQAYLYIKSLPEFQGSIDILEDGQ